MSYIGNEPPNIGAYGVESFNGGGTSFTLSKAAETATVLLFIDGVRQTPVDAYSVSGTTLTTTATTPSGTDNVTVQFLGDVVDFGTPSDNSVTTAKIVDDAVTVDKLANSINTEITANTAKVTNATHTGDVTGATALTIASGAVDLAMLSATGTADATTFLRGDNAWASAGDDNAPSFMVRLASDQTFSSSTWTKIAFDTEDWDVGSNFDTSNNRFVAPADGKYMFIWAFQFPSINSTGHRGGTFAYINGVQYGFGSGGDSWGGTDHNPGRGTCIVLDLSTSDYVEIFALQNTGGDKDIQSSRCFFQGFVLAGV